MDALLLIARLGLAAMLAIAAFGKVADIRHGGATLQALGVPRAASMSIAIALPVVELTIAATLLISPLAPWGALAAAGLFALFTVVIAWNLVRGRTPDCNCFGALH